MSAIEPFLLRAGYDLVERGQVEKLTQEQSFSRSEHVDPATAQSLGKILGVNAKSRRSRSRLKAGAWTSSP